MTLQLTTCSENADTADTAVLLTSGEDIIILDAPEYMVEAWRMLLKLRPEEERGVIHRDEMRSYQYIRTYNRAFVTACIMPVSRLSI